MQKKILISFMLIARFACAINNELQSTEGQQKYEAMILIDRVKNFRTWQELHKYTFIEKKIDDPEIVARYIDLTLFSDNAASKFKNSAFVKQAQQFAQEVCPNYEYWSDYFRVKSVAESKIYEPEKMVQIILEPTMQIINRLKHQIELLSGEYTEDFLQPIDWKKETELLEVHMNEKINNITLFSLIERAIAFRRPEYNLT